MATAHHEIHIQTPAARVWELVRDFHAAPTRMAPGFATDSTPDGADVRVVTFANGAVARERLISCDETLRRTVFSIIGGTVTPEHDNSSMQVFDDAGGCRFVWIHDVLPDELAPRLSGAMERALPILKHTAETQPSPAEFRSESLG
jgi:Polyketide cyclase / dehydrase and lipid transport